MYKKIVHIIPSLELGGAEILLEGLTYEQSKTFNVVIICLYNRESVIRTRMEKQGISIISLNKKRGFDFKLLKILYRTILEINPNIIHTHLNALLHVLIIKHMLKKTPIIHTIHTTVDKEFNFFKRVFISYSYKKRKVIPIAISNQIKESFVQKYKKTKVTPSIIWNGIDVNKILFKECYEINSPIKLVNVGNFKEAKNHKDLIPAFANLYAKNPNFELHLIGTGPLQPNLVALVDSLNINENVIFHGQRSDVQQILKEFDIFILVSLWEGMPISIIEAMSAGLPIVSTNVGGIPDMIDDKIDGILIDVSLKELSEVVTKLSVNIDLRKKYGESARKKSQLFTVEEMSTNYNKVYDQLIK